MLYTWVWGYDGERGLVGALIDLPHGKVLKHKMVFPQSLDPSDALHFVTSTCFLIIAQLIAITCAIDLVPGVKIIIFDLDFQCRRRLSVSSH